MEYHHKRRVIGSFWCLFFVWTCCSWANIWDGGRWFETPYNDMVLYMPETTETSVSVLHCVCSDLLLHLSSNYICAVNVKITSWSGNIFALLASCEGNSLGNIGFHLERANDVENACIMRLSMLGTAKSNTHYVLPTIQSVWLFAGNCLNSMSNKIRYAISEKDNISSFVFTKDTPMCLLWEFRIKLIGTALCVNYSFSYAHAYFMEAKTCAVTNKYIAYPGLSH